jgi:hypothetical protein
MTMAKVEHEENYDSLGLQKKDERPLAVRDTTERKPPRMPQYLVVKARACLLGRHREVSQ